MTIDQEGLAVLHQLYRSETTYGRADLRPFMLAKLRAVEAAQHSHRKETTMTIEENSGHPFTFGEKAVGLSFNPSNDPVVDALKKSYANIIDILDYIRTQNEFATPEQKRLASIAVTEAQGAQMWAVKAVTWKD